MIKRNARFAVAEALGVIALLAALFGYILLMGAEIVSGGAGLILMFVSITAYLLFTWLSQRRPTTKGYWIIYAVKIAFMIGLFLLSPVISRVLAKLING